MGYSTKVATSVVSTIMSFVLFGVLFFFGVSTFFGKVFVFKDVFWVLFAG